MLRYQVIADPKGHYLVLPDWVEVIPISESYTTRAQTQHVADRLNRNEPVWFDTTSLSDFSA